VNFSEKDILQIEEKGLSTKEVEEQVEIFKRGNIKVNIIEAATVGNGISRIDSADKKELIDFYDTEKNKHSILKFVPASGAASRMFKALHNFADEFNPEKENLRDYLDKKQDDDLQRFFNQMEDLPFYEHAVEKTKKNHSDYEDLSHDKQHKALVKTILESDGLYLSNLPKGLVPFHRNNMHTATAFEEHLLEAAKYVEVEGVAKLHFTVAKGDKDKFKGEWKEIQERVEKKTGVKFEIEYSFQDPKTDTIAVDNNFEPFRTEENNLFFRPGGHGALIENLNQLDEEIIFIKNIDNVVTEGAMQNVANYKKMLGGKLFRIQQRVFNYLETLDKGNVSSEKLDEIQDFLKNELFIKSSSNQDLFIENLKHKLHRPLRVCGMVKNEAPEEPHNDKLKSENYDLSDIYEFSGHDDEAMQTIIQAFLEGASNSMLELEAAYRAQDIDKMGKLAHRMLPMLRQMKANEVTAVLMKMESRDEVKKPEFAYFQKKLKELMSSLETDITV